LHRARHVRVARNGQRRRALDQNGCHDHGRRRILAARSLNSFQFAVAVEDCNCRLFSLQLQSATEDCQGGDMLWLIAAALAATSVNGPMVKVDSIKMLSETCGR